MTNATDQQTETRKQRAKRLRDLARDIHEGRVFTSFHIPDSDEHLFGMVFMPVLFGLTDDQLKDTVMVYEYMHKAEPRSINGYPIFFSCRTADRREARALLMLTRLLSLRDRSTNPLARAWYELRFSMGGVP